MDDMGMGLMIEADSFCQWLCICWSIEENGVIWLPRGQWLDGASFLTIHLFYRWFWVPYCIFSINERLLDIAWI